LRARCRRCEAQGWPSDDCRPLRRGGDVAASAWDCAVFPHRRLHVASRYYRLEYCGRLRALCRPTFLRSTSRASRVRKPARRMGMRRFSS